MKSILQKLSELSYYNLYGTDSGVYVLEESDNEVEDYLDNNQLEWDYYDEIVVDYEDDELAYRTNWYGEDDYIITDNGIIGRRRIEYEDFDHEEFLEQYINCYKKAIPSWYTSKWLVRNFEKVSCEFESGGWYGRNDDPKDIMNKTKANGEDLIFQIDHVSQFATGFCVWGRECVNLEN